MLRCSDPSGSEATQRQGVHAQGSTPKSPATPSLYHSWTSSRRSLALPATRVPVPAGTEKVTQDRAPGNYTSPALVCSSRKR